MRAFPSRRRESTSCDAGDARDLPPGHDNWIRIASTAGQRDVAVREARGLCSLALIAIVCLAAGCAGASSGPVMASPNGDGGAPDTSETPGDVTCYQPADHIDVRECARTSLCLSTAQATTVDPTHCAASTCRWTYQVNLGDTLTFDGGDTGVFLRFHNSIAGATTTDALAAAFEYVNFYRTYPVTNGPVSSPPTYFEQRMGVSAFDAFSLANGRLHVRLSFTIHDPYSRVHSTDEACIEGDVGGTCSCRYGSVSLPATIDIDLPADVP